MITHVEPPEGGTPDSTTRTAAWVPAHAPQVRVRPDALLGAFVAAVPASAILLFGGVEPQHVLPVQAGALLLGAGALLRRVRRSARPLPAVPVTLPVLLLAALPAFQLVPLPTSLLAFVTPGLGRLGMGSWDTVSVYPHETLLACIRWMSYAAFFIAALEFLREPPARLAALSVTALLGVAEATYGIGNLLTGNRTLLWLERYANFDCATGTFVNRNHFAAAMTLTLGALLARMWLARQSLPSEAERGRQMIFGVGATVIGVAVLLSKSRGGILAMASALFLVAVFAPRDHQGRRGRRLVAAVVAFVALYGWLADLGPVLDRFATSSGSIASDRSALWHDTVRIVRDFPLAGAGAGTFGHVLVPYRSALRDQHVWSHAHQDYLELAAEGGAVAVVLVLSALGAFAAMVARRLPTLAGQGRLALGAILGGLSATLLHAAVDFPLHIPGIAFLTVMLGALAIEPMRDGENALLRGHAASRRRRPTTP